MKSFLALLAVVVTITGCKKDSDKTPSTVYGKWELQSSFGNFTGSQTYPRGNGNTYEFTTATYVRTSHYGDSTYQMSGPYRIFESDYCMQASKQQFIEFDSTGSLPFAFKFSGSTITISTPECLADGGTATYRRISP